MPKPDFVSRGHLGVDRVSVGPIAQYVNEIPQYKRLIEKRDVGLITTIYIGRARYGVAESTPEWMIQKLTLDKTNGLDVTDQLAGGVAGEYSYTWTGRAGHSYS